MLVVIPQYLVFECKILDRLSVTGFNLSIKLLLSYNFSISANSSLYVKQQERNRSISLFCIKQVKLRPCMILLHIYSLKFNYVTTKY